MGQWEQAMQPAMLGAEGKVASWLYWFDAVGFGVQAVQSASGVAVGQRIATTSWPSPGGTNLDTVQHYAGLAAKTSGKHMKNLGEAGFKYLSSQACAYLPTTKLTDLSKFWGCGPPLLAPWQSFRSNT
jgi:hypothetical protein